MSKKTFFLVLVLGLGIILGGYACKEKKQKQGAAPTSMLNSQVVAQEEQDKSSPELQGDNATVDQQNEEVQPEQQMNENTNEEMPEKTN